MAENNRNFSIFLLVLALFGAALFYGCGSATSDAVPAIEYSITGSYNSQGLVTNSSARAVSGPAAGILIYSESDPGNYADIDVNNRTYIIRNLRPGTHYIVFKHIPFGIGGTTYICRSEKPVVLTETAPVQKCNELKATECSVSITGKLLSSTGQPITPTPTISLWGQTIEVNPVTGEYTTPKMPEGTTADLIINAVNHKQTSNTVTFANNPAYHEITAVETTSLNVPPTVDLSSKDSKYLINALVILNAEAEANGNKNLEFSWAIESCTSPNQGKLELSTEFTKNGKHISQYYWYSPSEDCLATISVTVTEKDTLQKLSSTAKLKLQIGNGQYKPNTKPQIIDTTIYPSSLFGSRQYTITCIATDTEMDALTHLLTITPSGSILQKASGNTWTWHTPELDEAKNYTLNFEVRDKKGNLATYSRQVTVNKSQPNESPYIVSQNPSSATDIMSGKEISLSIEAKDPENEKLSFNWSTRKGQIKASSESTNTASITWVAPYLNNATSTEITCIVSDPYQKSVTATFTLNIQPDPNKKAPESEIIITGTDVMYNGSIPLFKVGETVTFTGMATDSNRNLTIDPSHFTWTVIDDKSKVTSLPSQKATTTFSISNQIASGNYQVRLAAIDLNGITGEQTADFRVNSLPISNIICEGNAIDSTGRMTPQTTYTYNYNSKDYDVFQVSADDSEKVHFIASCTDIETDSSTVEATGQWLNGNSPSIGREFDVPLNIPGLTTIQLSAKDSKGEQSATATYQYYVNEPPVIETATSTKGGFINTDVININAKVKDESGNLSLAWYISTEDGSGNYSDYQPFSSSNAPTGAAISTSAANKELTSKISVLAENLVASFSDSTGFRFKFIASDSIGGIVDSTDFAPEFNIEFSVVTSHQIKAFEVASGTYGDSKLYTNYEVLKEKWGIATAPYIFPANAPFTMRSGSEDGKWENNMTWTWYDIVWTNGKPGASSKISDEYVDAYTLNGYNISSNFGTHTIRLEGKSNEYGIVASNSVDIFINSTPGITFAYADDDMIRFDTGSGATLTVNITEDNKNEMLGLNWTIQKLGEDNKPTGPVYTFDSHDLDSSTTSKSSISMGGNNKTSVTIYWNQIEEAPPLASGVFRITARVYDPYEASSTATIDVLINRLPEFNEVSEGKCITISVPDIASDTGEVYTDFQEQFATTSADIPVYLTEGLPSMYLNFEVDAFDYELNQAGIDINTYNNGKNIVWNYTDDNDKPMEVTGKKIGGRFSIGLNTIRVEVRDSFYDIYEGKFKSLAVASYTQQFYVWHSQSEELDNDNYYTATNIFKNEDNKFYVQLKDLTGGAKIATYTSRYQIILGVATTFGSVVPFEALNEIYQYEEDGDSYKLANATYTPGILNIIPTSDGKIIHLTNSTPSTIANYYKYDDDFLNVATYSHKQYRNMLVYANSPSDNNSNHVLSTFFRNGYPQGADPSNFAEKFISLTYSSSKDDTAGAYILKNWPTNGKYSIGIYSNTTMSITPNYTAVSQLDNKNLALTDDSKLRCISTISGLDQQLYLTDTNNNRIIRLGDDMANSNKLVDVASPIDIISTKNKYLITLSNSGDKALNVYQVDNASATLLTSFGSFASAGDRTNKKKRAGKVLEPRALFYHTADKGNGKIYGGLVILEKGETYPSRIQIIRTNLENFLD